MPAVSIDLSFIADLPLYKEEKPFLVLLPPGATLDPSISRTNLEYETHEVSLRNIREAPKASIEETGFEVLNHKTKVPFAEDITANEFPIVDAYKKETEELLKTTFGAVHVFCYDFRLRENRIFERNAIDLGSPLVVEGPAYGAHSDVTARSGPEMIQNNLSPALQQKYLKPGYRLRIVNTWRILNPVAQDSPLALCDFRTVQSDDLVPADRVIPGRAGEVYYVKYNESQEWYWLEEQKPDEPMMFIMYDTKSGNQARICPHIGFENPKAPANAPPRRSVETRSIVISYLDGKQGQL